jgi:hypothetical protein
MPVSPPEIIARPASNKQAGPALIQRKRRIPAHP